MTLDTTDPETQEPPVPDVEELPVQPTREWEDVPLPRRITRETEAGGRQLHRKEDLQHGDEGIDDPPGKSD